MRTRALALVVLATLALLVASCGGGSGSSSGDTSSGGGATTTTQASSSGGGSAGSGKGGDVDCPAVKKAAQELLGVQLLAQLRDAEAIAAIKAKTIGNLDIPRFKAAMKTLHQLDGWTSSLGDPKPAIEVYEAAADQAQQLFDANPPTQAAIDAYNISIGGTSTFLGHQTAIAGGLDAAGC
jgi:hypothetical protein